MSHAYTTLDELDKLWIFTQVLLFKSCSLNYSGQPAFGRMFFRQKAAHDFKDKNQNRVLFREQMTMKNMRPKAGCPE